MNAASFRIVDYAPRWRGDFARLNIEWLERWFTVEPIDREVLGDPETHILAPGGHVLFAIDEHDRVVGTVALKCESAVCTKSPRWPSPRKPAVPASVVRLCRACWMRSAHATGANCSWNPTARSAQRSRCTKASASAITPHRARGRTTRGRMCTWCGSRMAAAEVLRMRQAHPK